MLSLLAKFINILKTLEEKKKELQVLCIAATFSCRVILPRALKFITEKQIKKKEEERL